MPAIGIARIACSVGGLRHEVPKKIEPAAQPGAQADDKKAEDFVCVKVKEKAPA
jgi:hypothetical protein